MSWKRFKLDGKTYKINWYAILGQVGVGFLVIVMLIWMLFVASDLIR